MRQIPWDVPNKNVDETSLVTNLRHIKNGYMLENKSIRKRPGLKIFASVGSGRGIDGKYSWSSKGIELVVSGGKLYAITDLTGTVVTIASGILQLDTRVSFTEIYDVENAEMRVFMANGGQVYWTNGSTYGTCTGALAPTQCYSVTSIDTYLLALDKAANPYGFNWSVVGDPSNFDTGAGSHSSSIFTEEVLALGVNNDKIYVFSNSFIETFYDSGDAIPFVPVPGGVLNYGIVGKDAVAYLADVIFTLNMERDLVGINNFTMNILSFNYSKFLQQISIANDVEFDLIKGYGGRKWVVMSFKDANLTLVYDIITKAFYEWGTWSGATDNIFDGRCYNFNALWNKHLIGSRSSDIIYEIDIETYTDNSNPIHTEILTAHYNMSGFDIINSVRTYVDTKRGVGDLETDYAFMWESKDNREAGFSNQVTINLGVAGQTKITDPLVNTGRYRTRQHRITHQDPCEFVLNGIWEGDLHE